jgi:hypothetical protein
LPTDEFLYSAQMMSQITPLEVDILFQLCNLIHPRGGLVCNFLNFYKRHDHMIHSLSCYQRYADVCNSYSCSSTKKCNSPPECVKKRWDSLYSMIFPEGSNPDNSPLYVVCCNDTCSFTWTGAEHINQVCIRTSR